MTDDGSHAGCRTVLIASLSSGSATCRWATTGTAKCPAQSRCLIDATGRAGPSAPANRARAGLPLPGVLT